MRRLMVFILWLIVAFAALVIVVGFFAAIGRVDRGDLSEVVVSAEIADSALDKVAQFGVVSARARASGESQPVQIIFSDAEITSLISDWGRQSDWWGSIDRLEVWFGPDVIVLTGEVMSLGLNFDFRLDLELAIEQSERRVAIRRMQVGDIHAPGFITTALLELVTRTVDAGLPRIPMRIESLVLDDGELIVSGAAIP
ncbi:MAG: hypothetical protein OXU21_11925 [Chloroflexota bacterium]|nr:hypothetical protein [Chloroflexota bacterium]